MEPNLDFYESTGTINSAKYIDIKRKIDELIDKYCIIPECDRIPIYDLIERTPGYSWFRNMTIHKIEKLHREAKMKENYNINNPKLF